MSQQNNLVDLKDYIYGTEVIEEEDLFSPDLKEGDIKNTAEDNACLALRKKIQNDIDQILNSSNDDHKAVSNYFKKLINSDPEKKRRLNFCYFCVLFFLTRHCVSIHNFVYHYAI